MTKNFPGMTKYVPGGGHGKLPQIFRTIDCDFCHQPFETANIRQRFCPGCHEAICPICDKPFKRNFRGQIQTACSRSCASKLASQRRTKTMLICGWCEKEFSPANGHLKTKYCCQDCRYASKRKNDPDQKRNSYKYKQWKEAVYRRDNYTCQSCGGNDGVQAHHIKPWKDHKELRYDVGNGLTLCQTCHSNLHGAKIPRVSKKGIPRCADCDRQTSGQSLLCKSCAMKKSPKAQKDRASRLRNQNGCFARRDRPAL